MIPAITIFSLTNWLKKVNVKRVRKIRLCDLGFREIVLATDVGSLSLLYNYKTQSLIISNTKVPISEDQPQVLKTINRLVANCVVDSIYSPNFERILVLKLCGTHEYSLIIEIFGRGNTILANSKEVIKAVENPIRTKIRDLTVESIYEPPISNKINPLSILKNNGLDILRNSLLNRPISDIFKIINLDKYSLQEVLNRSGIKPDEEEYLIGDEDLPRIHKSLIAIMEEAASCNIYSIIYDDKPILVPFKVSFTEKVELFNECIDACNTYLKNIVAYISRSTQATKPLKKQINCLIRRKEVIESELALLEDYIPKLYEKLNELTELFDKVKRGEKINYKVNHEKKVVYLPVGKNLFVPIRYDLNPMKAISLLYDTEIKPRKRGLDKIINKIKEMEKQLSSEEELRIKEKSIEFRYTPLRKKEWYESFRWFFTSGGFLVIGGRDARSNRRLIKKYMDKNDLVFHADYYGSPFVILKNGKRSGEKDIFEAAVFTASFSRAWRDGLSVVDVYYVEPEQVSESPPSGEYMKKGAFMIYGKRNYIRKTPLELCISYDKDADKVIIGPCSAIASKNIISKIYLIYPGVKNKGDVAKKLAQALSKDVADEVNIDLPPEYLVDLLNNLLPNGKINWKVIPKEHFKDR